MSIEFRTDAVFEALKSPLALVEDPEKRQAFERYVEAARSSLERAVFDLLSEMVSAVDARVSDRYHLRLSYRPGALSLDVDPVSQPAGASADDNVLEFGGGDGETEKITIRIPAELKDLATQAASAAGLSANSWFVRAMARSLRGMEDAPRPPHAPHPPHTPHPPHPPEPPRGPRPPQGKRLQGWYGGTE